MLFINPEIRDEMERISKSYASLIAPLRESLAKISEEYSKLISIPKIQIPPSLKAVDRIRKAQYVYWDFLDDKYIDAILSSNDIDSTLLSFENDDQYSGIEKILTDLSEDATINKRNELFKEIKETFEDGKYSISVIGIAALIDFVLTDTTGKSTHNANKRCDAILEKIKSNDEVTSDEYALMTLALTYHEMMDTFYEYAPFESSEPDALNRNWIMHGRSVRQITKLDCIKLFRFLRGIILINKIYS